MPRILIMLIGALFLQALPPIYLPFIVNQPPPTATATVVPTATPQPTATATATATSAPTATAQPTPTNTPNPSAPCPCDSNSLNCSDFDTQPEAQVCYDFCMATIGSDIHRLDGNPNNGIACESLPPFWRYLTVLPQN